MYLSRGNVNNGGGCACGGARSIWEISVPSSHLAVNRKLLPPKKSLKKKSQGSLVELTAQPMFTGLKQNGLMMDTQNNLSSHLH